MSLTQNSAEVHASRKLRITPPENCGKRIKTQLYRETKLISEKSRLESLTPIQETRKKAATTKKKDYASILWST